MFSSLYILPARLRLRGSQGSRHQQRGPPPLTADREGHACFPRQLCGLEMARGVDASGGQDAERTLTPGRVGGGGQRLAPRLAPSLPTWTAMYPSLSLQRYPSPQTCPLLGVMSEGPSRDEDVSSAPGRGRGKQRHKMKRGPTARRVGFLLPV